MSQRHLCPRIARSGIFAPFVMGVFWVLSGCNAEAPSGPSSEAAAPGPSAAPTAVTAPAAPAVPEGTDVWLLDLVEEGGALRAKSPRNLTARPGYDNQPSFSPQGDVLFVQMEDERTDLWRWSPDTERATRVTATIEESEFSPTPIPDSEGGISYIRSKTDTSGRLWRMPREGADAEIVFADIGPVGYHAWLGAGHVALWRLQEPSLLQVVELATQEARTLATAVGRSPQSVPNRRAVSFTRVTDAGRVVEAYDLDLDRTELLAVLLEGGDFHAWTPDGVLLSSVGSRVLAWRDGDWQEVVDLADRGLTVSRLAVSPDGTRLALVAEPAQ